MAEISFDTIKRNPVAIGAIVVVGGLGLWALTRGGSDASAASGPSPYDMASLSAQVELTKDQLAASSGIRQAEIARDLQIAAIREQGASTLAIARENNATSLEQSRIAATSATQQIQAEAAIAAQRIDAQVVMDTAARGVQLAQIDATLRASLASITSAAETAQLQTMANVRMSELSANVLNNQITQVASIQRAQIKAATTTSLFGSLMGFAGRAFF